MEEASHGLALYAYAKAATISTREALHSTFFCLPPIDREDIHLSIGPSQTRSSHFYRNLSLKQQVVDIPPQHILPTEKTLRSEFRQRIMLQPARIHQTHLTSLSLCCEKLRVNDRPAES